MRFESQLPGLGAWGRVQAYRLFALQQMPNVNLYLDSELAASNILELEHQRVAIATGATWQRSLYSALEIPHGTLEGPNVYTPDDIAAGVEPEGPVLVYDFDNYYMGGLIAEALAGKGTNVSYATPTGHASAWTIMTNEQPFVHQALHDLEVEVYTQALLGGFEDSMVTLNNIFTNKPCEVEATSVVIVGLRLPNDELYHALMQHESEFDSAGIKSVQRIGDCLAPGAPVHAVHSGHLFARQLDEADESLYLRDIPVAETSPGKVI